MARMSNIQSRVAALAVVTSAAADTVFAPDRPSRLGLLVMNDSSSALNLLLAATGAAPTNKTLVVPAGGYYELWDYTGPVCGYWTTANGFAYVTELE